MGLHDEAKLVNFVGYRTWAGRRFVRRRALKTFRAAVRRGDQQSIAACLGHARQTHSLQHLLRHMETAHGRQDLQL